MKKWVKILLWILGSTLTLLTIGFVGIHLWLSTKWTDFYTESEMKFMTSQIDSAHVLPENFYTAYDRLFPDQRDRSVAKMSLQGIWYSLTMNSDRLLNYKQCNCIQATNFFESKVPIDYHSWTAYITAHGFEKYTEESKCLDYVYDQLPIDSLAIQYFKKPIQELTIKQSAELILRLQKPTLYDKRPDLLEKELQARVD